MDFGIPRIPQITPGTGLLRAGLSPDFDRLPVDGTVPGGPIPIAGVTGLQGDLDALTASVAAAEEEADKPNGIALWIEDLPTADPAKALYRVRFPAGMPNITFSGGTAEAEVAATAASALRLRKNGAANGTIAYTGTSGVISFTSATYAAGDLFELYPPAAVDATLDGLAITLPIV